MSKPTSKSTVPMPSSSSPSSSSVPEVTIFTRVASIPIISYSLKQVSGALSSNPYTASPYSTAKGISLYAYNCTAPLQVRLAPLIESADGYANKAVDVVQSKYPYPFEAKPEDVASYVRERRQSAADFVAERRLSANKTIDEKVKAPAITVACDMDQHRRNSPPRNSAPADTQYQYQRAYVLSKNVTGQLYDYSNQTALVQRASQTADSITALASSANSRIHALSDSLLAELQRLQNSLLADTITALRGIVATPNLPLNEKVARVGAEVQDRVRPMLNRMLSSGSRMPIVTTINGKRRAQQ
ncbi:hypothetical protein B0H10DRAFT_2238742 [Mycena sp. CBHHK59/15]|nr:hypothetical protein B0H10DRAFT_2238742 [Mycena sp. CBHHK59/15]